MVDDIASKSKHWVKVICFWVVFILIFAAAAGSADKKEDTPADSTAKSSSSSDSSKDSEEDTLSAYMAVEYCTDKKIEKILEDKIGGVKEFYSFDLSYKSRKPTIVERLYTVDKYDSKVYAVYFDGYITEEDTARYTCLVSAPDGRDPIVHELSINADSLDIHETVIDTFDSTTKSTK